MTEAQWNSPQRIRSCDGENGKVAETIARALESYRSCFLYM